jgi:hypothetical protein
VSPTAFAFKVQVPADWVVTVVPETVHTPVVEDVNVTELVLVVVAETEKVPPGL